MALKSFSKIRDGFSQRQQTWLLMFCLAGLLANILYLFNVRDAKQQQLEKLTAQTEAIEFAQLKVSGNRRKTLPQELLYPIYTGEYLKRVIDVFETSPKSGVLTEVSLQEIPAPRENASPRQQKNNTSLLQELHLKGSLPGGDDAYPYTFVTRNISQLFEETACKLNLLKGNTETFPTEAAASSLAFELVLPAPQISCLQSK